MKEDVSGQYSAVCVDVERSWAASGCWESLMRRLDLDIALCIRRLSPPSQ